MSMKRIVLLMLLFFISGRSCLPLVIPAGLVSWIVPHFIFVFVLFSALYSGRHLALIAWSKLRITAGFCLFTDI